MCNLVCFIACFAACEPGITAHLLRTPEGRDFVSRAVDRDFLQRAKVHAEIQRLVKLTQSYAERGQQLTNEVLDLSRLPTSEKTQKQAAALVLQMKQHTIEGKELDKEWEKLEILRKTVK